MTLSSPLSDCCSAPVTFVESTPKYTNYKCSRCGRNTCDLQPPAESGSGIVEAPTAQNIHRLLDENSEELCESFREYHTLAKQYIRSLESKLSVAVGCLTAIKKELGSYHKDKMHIYDSYTHGLCSDTLNRVSACLSKILPPT